MLNVVYKCSLGAKHDGEDINEACSAADNYVMAPVHSANKEVLKNAFRFSWCSIRDYKALLRLENGNANGAAAALRRG